MTEKNDTMAALVIINPNSDPEVMAFHAEAHSLLAYAETRVIATVEDLKPATDDLAIIAGVLKGMEAKRKEYLQPFQNHIKETNEAYKTLMEPIFMADRITRDKMLAFNQEQQRIRLEQEEINRKRTEAAEAEMRLKGESTEPVGLVEVAPEAPKRVSTEMGSAGMRDNWKWEVVDPLLIPREYLVVDNAQLTAIARRHHDQKPIPGVRFYNEPVIAVKAR